MCDAAAPGTETQDPRFAPGSFGCHEALHMASVLRGMVEEHLCQHPAIEANKEWSDMAGKACRTLFDLYQAIGQVHMEAPQ